MARQYTQQDYDKVLNMYNEYQAKKDSYDAEKQQRIDAMFWDMINNMIAQANPQPQQPVNPVIEWYWWSWYDDWAVYQVRKNWDTEQVLKNYNDIVDEVIAWKWWNWNARMKSLTDAWYDYNKIQELINQRMRGKKPSPIKLDLEYTPAPNNWALVWTWAVAPEPVPYPNTYNWPTYMEKMPLITL